MTKSEGYNKGDIYEDKIYKILIKKNFIKKGSSRAGASDRADIEVIHNGKNVRIEVKADENADYGQKSIKWSKEKGWLWAKSDKVTKFYEEIGIIENYGFYHLSEDKLNLNTKKFDGKMVLRLRAKTIHSKDKKGNPTPWNYNFYGVLKMLKKPTPSNFDLEEKGNKEFPFKN